MVRPSDWVSRALALRLGLFGLRAGRRPGSLVARRVSAELASAVAAVGEEQVLELLGAWIELVALSCGDRPVAFSENSRA